MKAYGEVDLQIRIFLTSALAGGEWSASRPCRFTPGERAPGTHWIGGWGGEKNINQNLVQKEIKRRLNSGNACYHSVQKLLSSRLLSKSVKIRNYNFAGGSVWV
jgi:hypothetical protein